MSEYYEHQIMLARLLRATFVRYYMMLGDLTREQSLEILNGPLAPDDPDSPVYDDREMLDWSDEQFEDFMAKID
jgi:hypothetical protein